MTAIAAPLQKKTETQVAEGGGQMPESSSGTILLYCPILPAVHPVKEDTSPANYPPRLRL